MQSLNPANHNFLLEVSMEDLHKDIALWLSHIEFWRVELPFFQKLLGKVAFNQPFVGDKQKIDHLQNLFLYYQGEVLDKFQQNIHNHELYLKNLIDNRMAVNDQYYRETHKMIGSQIQAFDKTMKEYKKDLYSFVEQIL